MSEQTRRDVMAEAWDKLDSTETETETKNVPETTPEPETRTAETVSDETGAETEAKGEKDSQEVEQRAADKSQKETKTPIPKSKEKVEPKQLTRAPTSWNAAEKLIWNKVPKEAQAAIARREKEIVSVLNESAGARQFAKQFLETINPYAGLIRAQNSTPLAAVQNLMQTAAGLTTGNPAQKAAIVAEICSNYGIDFKLLDDALVAVHGRQAQNPNYNSGSVDPKLLQMLQPIQQFIGEVQNSRQTRAQEMQSEAESQVEEFGADKPYFEDFREEMADYIDFQTSKGKKVTLDQAYDFVLQQYPEQYKEVMAQRRAASGQASKGEQTLEKARRAASSVSGAPLNGSGGKTPVSRRDHLLAAWESMQK